MKSVPRHVLAGVVFEALREDLGPGDVTSESVVPEDLRARAEVRARAAVVVAGIDAALLAFRCLDPGVQVFFAARDGDDIADGGLLLDVGGRARALLSAERTALNFLARLSGVATLTRRFVTAAAPHRAAIADTRKTTPTLRALEKYAVAVGGGANHRLGLWDAVLIKDNHVELAGSVRAAVERARRVVQGRLPVEVEVRNLEELEEAIEAGADAVLLDNFDLPELASTVRRARGRAFIEVSGGVRIETVQEIAALGVDRISIGALTHSAPAADLTMRVATWQT